MKCEIADSIIHPGHAMSLDRFVLLTVVCVATMAARSVAQAPAPAVSTSTTQDFRSPFVEAVHIIHEWDGERAGGQFGWIARGIGDVDGDGVADLLVTSAWSGIHGTHTGRVYVISSGVAAHRAPDR